MGEDRMVDSVAAKEDSGSTSSTLLARLKLRDPEAWQRLNHLYGPTIYAWCRQAGLGPDDAADTVQNVFHVLVRRVADFRRDRSGDTFRGWLWTITRNKIRDYYRLAKNPEQAVGGSDNQRCLVELAESPPPDDDDGAGILYRSLELLRSEFEARTWQAFWRTTVDEHYAADVAADLGISVNAVYKAKARVLARLRQELSELLE
jgi:RNA polymerase sigma-70 factor (ECF subfamily)